MVYQNINRTFAKQIIMIMNAANVMTEELQKDIDEARKEYKRGETNDK